MDDERLEEIFGQLFDAEDLCDVGAYDEAIAICDDVLMMWGAGDDTDLSEAIAEALLCRGRALGGLDRFEDELMSYDEIVKRFESDESPVVSRLVARAQFNVAVATGQMGLTDESLSRYTSFVDRYQTSRDPEIQEQVLRSLLNQAITLRHAWREEEALSHLTDLVGRYATSEEPEFYVTVAKAFASKAALELCMGQAAAAIESANRGVEKCGNDLPEERLQCHLVLAAAYLISEDTASAESQVASMLDLLPDLGGLPYVERFSFILRDMAPVIGRDRTLDLIRRSPSADILSPLAETLKLEICRESETLKSIEEMAKDLQTDFAMFDRFEN